MTTYVAPAINVRAAAESRDKNPTTDHFRGLVPQPGFQGRGRVGSGQRTARGEAGGGGDNDAATGEANEIAAIHDDSIVDNE